MTRSSLAWQPRWLAPLAGLLTLSVATAGCNILAGCDGTVDTIPVARCELSGAVQVASPTFAVPAIANQEVGSSCLMTTGVCGAPARAAFYTPRNGANGNVFGIVIDVALGTAPGTYALTGNETAEISIEAFFYSPDDIDGELVVRSGELVVSRNDAGGFSGTFWLELRTTDSQHHVSLSGGSFNVADCRVDSETYCFGRQS